MDGISIETVLLQILVLFTLAKLGGLLCERVGISSVIGEIAAGILVVNSGFLFSLIGLNFDLFHILSLDADMSLFEVLSELGVIFLLFAVGLETPFSELRKVGRTATLVAVLGVILPFFAGLTLILGLGHTQTEALFIGAAMVATSVGITARVIKDMDLTRSIESRVIIGAAVIDDVLGMIVLAIVVGITAGGSSNIIDIVLVSATGITFVLLVIFFGSIVLPKARKRVNERRPAMPFDDSTICVKDRKFTISPLPLAIIVCLGLSFAASFVGLAAIIGAFLAGMAFAEFKDKWPCDEDFRPINAFLVPFFFLLVGMYVDLAAFGDVLVIAGIVTLLAIITKYIGCGLGSLKLGRGSANIIGVGMIPRGEVGIIVATIGLSMGVVSQGMFSVVVFMSMVTTIIAPFVLTVAFRSKYGDCPAGDQFDAQQSEAAHP